MNAPCKDCTDRHYKCHSECKKYQEFDKGRKKILEENRKCTEEETFRCSVTSKLRKRGEKIQYHKRWTKYGR